MTRLFSGNKNPGDHLWPVLLISGIALLFNLNGWGVTETSEARYAEIAYEMYQTGDYLHPRLLEIQHYHKPPLTYWITALSYHIFGPNAFAARFFQQFMILIQMVLVFHLTQMFTKNRRTAVSAALIYISLPAVLISARALTTDVFLNTFVLLSVFFWAKRRLSGQPVWLYLTYLSLALGFMTKGPVVFIIPAVTIPLLNHLMPSRQKGQGFHHIAGFLLFLTTGASWYLYLVGENPAFLDYFVIDHTINRFATNQFNRGEPFWFYFLLVPAMSFPWLLLSVWHSLFKKTSQWTHKRVLWLWIGIPLIFFSLSTSKLILYVLPIFPAIAIISAIVWTNLSAKIRKRWNIALSGYHTLIISSLLVAGFVPLADINYSSSMYVTLGIMSTVVVLQILRISRTRNTVWIAASFSLLLIIFSTYFLEANPLIGNDQRNVALLAKEKLSESGHIMVYDRRLPSVAFHAHHPIISINNGNEGLTRETIFEKSEKWKDSLIDINDDRLNEEAFFEGSVLLSRMEDASEPAFIRLASFFSDRQTVDGWMILSGVNQNNNHNK